MEQPIENILAKYFSKEANREELEFIVKWVSENPEEFQKYKKAYELDIFETRSFESTKMRGYIMQHTVGHPISQYSFYNFQRIAAIFAGIMVLGTLLYFYNQSLKVDITNLTAANETHILPDGSEVILSANTGITFTKSWTGRFNRNLNLNGRAYFKVTKNPSNPFTVNTKNVRVTVLGTEFTINEIGEKTQVVLSEGKVKLSSSIFEEPVILDKLGDQLILDSQSVIKHNNVNLSLYAAWKEEKLYFNNCTVDEIVNLLDDSYDVRVDLDNDAMLERRLFGSAPSDDPQLIIKALSQILQTDFEIK